MSSFDKMFIFVAIGIVAIALILVFGLELVKPVDPDDPGDTTDETNNKSVVFVIDKKYSPNGKIIFSKSTDGGLTFTESLSIPETLTENSSIDRNNPKILLVWGNGESINRDNFSSMSSDEITVINVSEFLMKDQEERNSSNLALSNSNIHIIWKEFNLTGHNTFFSKSMDGGKSFTAPQIINNTLDLSYENDNRPDRFYLFVGWGDFFPSVGEGGVYFSKK